MSDSKEPQTPSSAEPQTSADAWTKGEAKVASSETKETPPVSENEPGWERQLINRLAFASLNEQRRARRWGIFFKSLTFVYLFVLLYLVLPREGAEITVGKHTALIDIEGVIDSGAAANADDLVGSLRDAFKDSATQGIILRINSPGGSPVQAGYIYDEILRLRNKHPEIKVYAVVSELAASAAYYIASAADEIYADKASIVGSIGVLMDGYGFVETMNKLGVERRLLTAGENKGFLDPFSPLKEKDKEFMQGLLQNVHTQFIDAVKRGRGNRIKDDPIIYSGYVWSGEKSIEMGLVDGLGSAGYVAREIIKAEKIVDFTQQPDYLARIADRIGAAAARSIMMMGAYGGLR